MITPNWKHHSKKQAKRKLKPVALKNRRRALQALKKEARCGLMSQTYVLILGLWGISSVALLLTKLL